MPTMKVSQGGFAGGMVLNVPREHLQPGQAEFLLNMFMSDGAIRPIPKPHQFRESMTISDAGSVWGNDFLVSVKPLAFPGKAVADYGSDRVAFVIWVTETSAAPSAAASVRYIEFRDPDTFFVQELFAVQPTYWGGDSTRWGACVGLNGTAVTVVTSNGTTGDLIGYVIGGAPAVLKSACYACDIIYHQERFWITKSGPTPAITSTLYVSDTLDPTAFPHSYPIGDPSERITKIVPMGANTLMIFKEYSVWLYRGYPGNSQVTQLSGTVGCQAPATIKKIPNSNMLVFVDSNWDIRVGGVEGQFQVAPMAVSSEVIRNIVGLVPEYADSGGVAGLYATLNHLGHYMLLPTNTTADNRYGRGISFDMSNKFWASWVDFASDSGPNTPRARLVTDTVLANRRADDKAGTPHQFIWPYEFEGDNDFPSSLFVNSRYEPLATDHWMIKTRPFKLPGDLPFNIVGGDIHAAVLATDGLTMLERFDDLDNFSVYVVPANVYTAMALVLGQPDGVTDRRSRVGLSIANATDTNEVAMLMRDDFSAQDWAGYTELYLDLEFTVIGDTEPIWSNITFTVNVTNTSNAGQSYFNTVLDHGGRVRITIDLTAPDSTIGTVDLTDITKFAIWTTGVNNASIQMLAVALHGYTASVDVSKEQEIQVDYDLLLSQARQRLTTPQRRLVVPHPNVELDAEDNGNLRMFKPTSLPLFKQQQAAQVQAVIKAADRTPLKRVDADYAAAEMPEVATPAWTYYPAGMVVASVSAGYLNVSVPIGGYALYSRTVDLDKDVLSITAQVHVGLSTAQPQLILRTGTVWAQLTLANFGSGSDVIAVHTGTESLAAGDPGTQYTLTLAEYWSIANAYDVFFRLSIDVERNRFEVHIIHPDKVLKKFLFGGTLGVTANLPYAYARFGHGDDRDATNPAVSIWNTVVVDQHDRETSGAALAIRDVNLDLATRRFINVPNG